MKKQELILKIQEEINDTPLFVNSNGIIQVPRYLYKYLLIQARIDFKGIRGVSSRKTRVKKKIASKQLSKMIRDSIG